MTTPVLRPVTEGDLSMLKRFAVEPGLIGNDWFGFRDAGAQDRRFALDGYLGTDNGRLMVQVGAEATGFVTWSEHLYGGSGSFWEIGIVLLPEWRGQGIGWRAQALLCDYLFEHTPAQRIQAGTQPENIAEQKSLVKAGFQLEGTHRSVEFRAGRWRDGLLYGRLRTDPRVTI